jgi:autotransporter-associated beta strand protein
MMLAMDRAIGTMIARLDDPDNDGDLSDSIRDNTLIVFLNDNGGASTNGSSNGVLRGWKGSMWEGGVRVPMLIAGAGIDPNLAGSSYDHPVSSIDIVPTCVAAAGETIEPNQIIDGVNLLPYVNGEYASAPHESIYHLFSVRKGDYKIVHDGGTWKLFNLETDISESNNLAAAQPGKLAELLQTMTAFDVQMDKARFGTYGSLDEVNNDTDHFVYLPFSGVLSGENLLQNPGFEEGDQDGDPRYTFAELYFWENATGNQGAIGARDDTAASGIYRGMVSWGQAPQQITSHLIEPNEVLTVSLQAAGLWQWDDADTFDVELFYVAPNDNVPTLWTLNVDPPLGSYSSFAQTFPPVTDPNAYGRPLGIRFISRSDQSGEWASIDDVSLSSTAGVQNRIGAFSAAQAWRSNETNQLKTLIENDGYANAVLEFPTSEEYSYTVFNDYLRITQLDFMANRILLTGSRTDPTEQFARIEGLPILLTSSLSGQPAGIEMNANGTVAGGFTFDLALDLLPYEDLIIAGDGDQSMVVSGTIREYLPGFTLAKAGASTLTLAAANELTGCVAINGGVLQTTDPQAIGTSDIQVNSGGALDVQGDLQIAGSYDQSGGGVLMVDIRGIAASSEFDQLIVGGDARLAGTLVVRTDPNFTPLPSDTYAILQANSITGTFDAIVADCGYEVVIDQTTVSVTLPCLAGDGDCDGWITSADWQQLDRCADAPGSPAACATQFDQDGDLDVDLLDIAAFQRIVGISTAGCP